MHRVEALQFNLKRLCAVLGVATALFALLYAVLLLLAVSHAAQRTAAERQMRDLGEAVHALEEQYFAAARATTPERAAQLGFVAPSKSVTVYAAAASKSVSFKGFGERSSQ